MTFYNKIIRCVIVYSTCITFLVTTTTVKADRMSDAGAQAKAEAQIMVQKYQDSPSTFSDETITTPDSVNPDGSIKPGTTVKVSDLFQGSASGSTTSMSEYFPADATPNISELQEASSDPDKLNKLSENFKNGLFVDSQKENPESISGDAYKLMINEHNRVKPNLKNDPVFAKTRAIQADIENITKSFSDCKTKSILNTFTTVSHIPDLKYCDKISAPNLSCNLKHTYTASPAVLGGVTGSGDSTIITLGSGSGDYLKSTIRDKCEVFDSSVSVVVQNPEAITSVMIKNYHIDDYAQILTATGANALSLVWQSPNGFHESGASCKDAKDSSGIANVDVTKYFKLATVGESVNFKFRQSVRGGGGGTAQVIVNFDRSKLITSDTWNPRECIDLANSVGSDSDPLAPVGTSTCTIMPPVTTTGGGQSPGCYDSRAGACYTLPVSTCTMLNGVKVCSSDLSNPIVDSTVSALCTDVKVDVTYKHLIESSALDCKVLEENPSCSYMSQKCVDGAIDNKGLCYITEETWDCGKDVVVEDGGSSSVTECVGPVRCMGSDCITPDQTKSTTFAQTAAKLQSVQFMTQDMNCNTTKDADGKITGITGCTVFGGKGFECKVALGGLQDCCDVPTAITASGYLTALMQMSKLNTTLMSVSGGSATGAIGTYQTMGKAIGQGVSEVTQPFTSYIENISGSVDSFTQPISAFIDELKQKIKDTITDTIKKMIVKMSEESAAGAVGGEAGSSAADAAAQEAAKAAAEDAAAKQAGSIVENMMGAASTLMAIYAYYVIIMMIIQAVFKCVDDEFDLAGRRKAMVCEKAGSYCKTKSSVSGMCVEKREVFCCYSSPLSRIIHEQVAPQLGIVSAPITAANPAPVCDGIPLSDISKIDWSKVDLSEWTAILTEYNLMPDAASLALEVLTGTGITAAQIEGNALNRISEHPTPNQPATPREGAVDRTMKRLEGIDVDQVRRDAADNTPVNPSGVPKD